MLIAAKFTVDQVVRAIIQSAGKADPQKTQLFILVDEITKLSGGSASPRSNMESLRFLPNMESPCHLPTNHLMCTQHRLLPEVRSSFCSARFRPPSFVLSVLFSPFAFSLLRLPSFSLCFLSSVSDTTFFVLILYLPLLRCLYFLPLADLFYPENAGNNLYSMSS